MPSALRPPVRAALVAAALVLALPGVAHAGTILLRDSTPARYIEFVGAGAERNDLTVTSLPGQRLVVFQDVASALHAVPSACGTINANTGACTNVPSLESPSSLLSTNPGGLLGYTVIDLGDGADALTSNLAPGYLFQAIVAAGTGDDDLTGGPADEVLNGESGDDVIDAGMGMDTVDAGPGNDEVDAQDQLPDRINCGDDVDVVYADAADVLQDCERVVWG